MELREDVNEDTNLVLWEFALDFDTLGKDRSGSGGNVTELPNSNILLCGGQLNRILEVSKKKEVVWDAFIYSLGKTDSVWKPMQNYRCSWVNEVFIPKVLVEA